MKVLIPFLAAFALSLVFGLVLAKIAPRIGLMDTPDRPRKIHPRPVPLVGGLAIWLAVTMGMATISSVAAPDHWVQSSLVAWRVWLLVSLFGLVGLLDDWLELSPFKKLTLQVMAVLLWLLSFLTIASRYESLAGWLSLTECFRLLAFIMWILLIANAVNYLDNINGLCAGTALIGVVGIGFVMRWELPGSDSVALLILAGAISGFLILNFPKGRVFLGDCGSLLLGALLAVLPVMASFEETGPWGYIADPWGPVSRWLALAAFSALPLVDFIQVTAGRLRRSQPIWRGDTNHLSHLLVRRGFTPVQAVLLLWLANGVIVNLVVVWARLGDWLFPAWLKKY